MDQYICLVCGNFKMGNEDRRLINLCPDCESKQASPEETILDADSDPLSFAFHFMNPITELSFGFDGLCG